MEETPGLPV